jgi:hypothetical protein
MTGWNLPPGVSIRDIPGCGYDDPGYELTDAEMVSEKVL